MNKTHTHTHPFNGPFPGLPRSAGTRKVKPIWILLEQRTVSDSGISWAICKSAPRSRQITTPAPHHSVFYRPDALPAAQPSANSVKALKATMNKTLLYKDIIIHVPMVEHRSSVCGVKPQAAFTPLTGHAWVNLLLQCSILQRCCWTLESRVVSRQ